MSYVEDPFAEQEVVRDFYATHAEVVRKERELEQAWIKQLNKEGTHSYMPNDGYANCFSSVKNHHRHFQLGNPRFRHPIGTTKAIGTPKNYRIVEVIGYATNFLGDVLHEYTVHEDDLRFELPKSE